MEAVRSEMEGSYINDKDLKVVWAEHIAKADLSNLHAIIAQSYKNSGINKQAADEGKLGEKEYYTKAYGDAGFAGDLTKGMDTKESAVLEENKQLKAEKTLRVKAQRALVVATKIGNMYNVPMTHDELKEATREIMKFDDASYTTFAGLITKIADRVLPGENGVVHNNLVGVEKGADGTTVVLSDQDGLLPEIERDAKDPESVITPPDVKARLDRRPVNAGVIPQLNKVGSRGSILDNLSERFTSTKNRLKAQGMDDKEIRQFEAQASRRFR